MHGRPPGLVQAVRAQFSRPNFSAHIGGQVLSVGIASLRRRNGTDRRRDPEDRHSRYGTHRGANGRPAGARPVLPACSTPFCWPPTRARMSAITSRSASTRVARPASAAASGSGSMGWACTPTRRSGSQVNTHATITDIRAINGSQLIERFAWRRAAKQGAPGRTPLPRAMPNSGSIAASTSRPSRRLRRPTRTMRQRSAARWAIGWPFLSNWASAPARKPSTCREWKPQPINWLRPRPPRR